MEHLESCGTKIMMRGPLYASYAWEETEKQTKIRDDEFHSPSHFNVVQLFCAAGH